MREYTRALTIFSSLLLTFFLPYLVYRFQAIDSARTWSALLQVEQADRTSFVHPLLRGPLDCGLIENTKASSYDSRLIDSLRPLLVLCDSTLRKDVHVSVHKAYLENYRRLSDGTGVISEGYVSFLRGGHPGGTYVNLSKVAITATHKFSQKPILLFVSGDLGADIDELWPPSLFPRLIIITTSFGVLNPYFDKLFAAVLSPVVRGVIIEADTLITPQAERLFHILRRYGHQAFPLMPTHEDVRWEDCTLYTGPKFCLCMLPYPHQDRSVDYAHAHLMWTVDSRPFLVEVLRKCAPGAKATIDCAHDEIALNNALWNAGATQQLCLMDPYAGLFMNWWESMDTASILARHNRTMGFIFIHGEKDA